MHIPNSKQQLLHTLQHISDVHPLCQVTAGGASGTIFNKRDKRDPGVAYLSPEQEEGAVEYKLRLRDGNPFRVQQLITQMKFRLCEGGGQCFYYIGAAWRGIDCNFTRFNFFSNVILFQIQIQIPVHSFAILFPFNLFEVEMLMVCPMQAALVTHAHGTVMQTQRWSNLQVSKTTATLAVLSRWSFSPLSVWSALWRSACTPVRRWGAVSRAASAGAARSCACTGAPSQPLRTWTCALPWLAVWTVARAALWRCSRMARTEGGGLLSK